MTVCAAFASALSARRAEYNAQFVAARRAAPELTEDAFMSFLSHSVDPLVAATAAHDHTAVSTVVDEAYALGLSLLGQRLAGPRAHHSAIDTAFRRLFPELVRFIAPAPGLVLPRLCNALHQLAATPGARPDAWCSSLSQLAPQLRDVNELFAVGQVSAWLSGLAHYRASALGVCRTLPEPLALAVLGAVPGSELGVVLARLERDPWFLPSAPAVGFRVVGRIGGFRGFGGAFLAPPRVVRIGQQLLVWCNDDAWLLTLDAFGCTLHRAEPSELTNAVSDVEQAQLKVYADRVEYRGRSAALLDTGSPRSVAGNETTLLIATEHSYAVTVVALEPAA